MQYLRYILKHYLGQILFAALLFGALVYASAVKPEWHRDIAWVEAIAGAGTLFFAAFLWLNSMRREWENNLPKRITVQYRWQGRNVMYCENALLVEESDARTWALQIGQQMSGCQKLKFQPFFDLQKRGIQTEKQTGQKYKSFVLTYYLTELPEPDQGTDEEKRAFKKRLEEGCIERYPLYHPDGGVSMTDGYNTSRNPIMQIST